MNLLCFDTSQRSLIAVASAKDRVVAFREDSSERRHSDLLIPVLDQVLREAKWDVGSLDAIVVGLGPGSFTGLRVGVTSAQLLAYAWKKRLAGFSSLELMARSALPQAEGRVAIALDARKGQWYAAIYAVKRGIWTTALTPHLTTPDVFLGRQRAVDHFIQEPIGSPAAVAVRPEALAAAAWAKASEKQWIRPEIIRPLYLYAKDCNVTIKKN